MNTYSEDQGSQSLEFALVTPLIATAVALLVLVGSFAVSLLMTQGVAQHLARQVALNGPINPPAGYQLQIQPINPPEGGVFHVSVERSIPIPVPGMDTWRIRQQVWGVRAPKASSPESTSP